MGKKRTEEQRERYRAAARKRSADPEYRKKLSIACQARSARPDYAVKNREAWGKWFKENQQMVVARLQEAVKTPAARANLRAANLASIPQQRATMIKKWQDPEARKMYLSVIGTNHQPEYLDARGRVFKFRSTWELEFARWLDENDLTWVYEADAILLSTGRTYIPDFWVQEWQTYVEIKGGRSDPDRKWETALADGHPILVVRNHRDVIMWAGGR